MSDEPPVPNSGITVRQLQVDFAAGFPRSWHSGEPYLSHYWNSFSMMFPLGERHTVDIARDCLAGLEKCARPELLADALAFIGQEAAHRRVHIQYNRILDEQGYANRVEPILAWQLRQARRCSLPTQLAMGAAFEHWTATVADYNLSTPAMNDGMAELPRRVWEWHGAEETEHKSVLFDLYRWSGGGYWRRLWSFLFISVLLFFDLSVQRAAMLHRDRALHRIHTWRLALRGGFGRQGSAWHHLPQMAAYLRPGFHPKQRDGRPLVEDWKRRAAGGYRIVHAAAAASPSPETE